MARRLGEAFTVIKADLSGFGREVKTGVERVTKALRPDVTVRAAIDDKAAKLGFADLRRQRDDLAKKITAIPVGLDDKLFEAKRLSLISRMEGLNKKKIDPEIDLQGAARFSSQLLRLEAEADKLDGRKINVKLDVDRSLLSKVRGLFGGGGGGGPGGGAGGLVGALPAAQGLLNPYTIIAGLAALPFAAQAAAGGIVAALGGGLAAVALIGASKTKSVQKSFADLKTHASTDLASIGTSFVPVANSILHTARSTLDKLTPVFAGAAKTISGPFKDFADTLIRAFGQPAIKNAIKAVAKAFGDVLSALTPQLPGIVQTIADGIKRIAEAVSKNPKAIADFVTWILKAGGYALDLIAALTDVATYIEQHFVPAFKRARHDIAHWWDDLTNDIAKTWDIVSLSIGIGWDKIKLFFIGGVSFIVGLLAKLPGPLGAPFRQWRDDLKGVTASIQADIAKRTGQIQGDIDSIHGKTVQVHMNGQGLYTITGSIIAASQGKGGSGNAAGGLAGGGLIRMGSGPVADDVPAMLSRGELVVPAAMVNAGAVDHLRGHLPGFAKGGTVSRSTTNLTPGFMNGMQDTFESSMSGAMVGAMRTSLKAAEAAARAAAAAMANPFAGITGIPSGGPIGAGAAAAQAFARSILWAYGWGQNQFPPLQALWNGESGWRWNALNPASGAYGIPQSLPASKMASAGPDWRTNPATQIRWGLGYIKAAYGSPAHAYGLWLSRSPHWYAEGGLVGYASGGKVTKPKPPSAAQIAHEGADFLHAWQTRHGGGFGAAWGPVVLNQQIEAMQAAMHRNTILASARGLTSAQHKHYAALAADERKRLVTLNRELTVERAWRGQLGSSDTQLQSYISAAGATPSLAKNVRAWEKQLAWQKWTIGNISKMLGWSNAHIAADVAAGRLGPGGTPLPKITHTFGGDVGDTISAYLAAQLSPLGLARGGQVKSYDRGGYLAPGLNLAYNGTGRPEPVGAQPVELTISFDPSFQKVTGLTQRELANIRYTVKRNGGDVQSAFGQPNVKFVRK